MHSITIYTDGACSGNPGPGGWGCVLILGKQARKLSGFSEHTTNNRMELQGVITALQCLQKPCKVKIFTDSKYVQDAFVKGWLDNWQLNGWKTKQGAVKNQDLWVKLTALRRIYAIEWEWVKGHSGNYWNEICDQLARNAITTKQGIDLRFSIDDKGE